MHCMLQVQMKQQVLQTSKATSGWESSTCPSCFQHRTVDWRTATVDQESPGIQLQWKKQDNLIYHSAVQNSEVLQWQQTKPRSQLNYSHTPKVNTTGMHQWVFIHTPIPVRSGMHGWRNSVYKPTPATRYALGQILTKHLTRSEQWWKKAGLQNHLATKLPMFMRRKTEVQNKQWWNSEEGGEGSECTRQSTNGLQGNPQCPSPEAWLW